MKNCYDWTKMKVLFVCRANTARSQMAAGLYNKLSKKGHADSAGTNADNAGETITERARYRPAAQHTIDVMSKEGIDISANLREQLTKEMIDKYDKIIVMAEPETIPDYLKNSTKYIYWEIEDPKGGNYEVIHRAKEVIKAKVVKLIEQDEKRD